MVDIQGLGRSQGLHSPQTHRPQKSQDVALTAIVRQLLSELKSQLKSLPQQQAQGAVKTPTESEYMSQMLGTTPTSQMRGRSKIMSLSKALGISTVNKLSKALNPRQAVGHLKKLFEWKPTSFDQQLMNQIKGFFTGIHYVEPTEDGSLSPELTSHHVMGLKYNPLADSESRLEGNLFRAYCMGEDEAAPPQFLDEAREILKLSDQYGVNSQPVRDQLKFLYKHYISETAPKSVHLSEDKREAAAEAYKALIMAERNLRFDPDDLSHQQALEDAQTQLMNALAECNIAIHELLDKTLQGYNKVRGGLKSQLESGGSKMGRVWKGLRSVQQNWWNNQQDWGKLKQGVREIKSTFSEISQAWGMINPMVIGAYFLSSLLPEEIEQDTSQSEVNQLMQRYSSWQQGIELSSDGSTRKRLGVEDYLEQFKRDEHQIFSVVV